MYEPQNYSRHAYQVSDTMSLIEHMLVTNDWVNSRGIPHYQMSFSVREWNVDIYLPGILGEELAEVENFPDGVRAFSVVQAKAPELHLALTQAWESLRTIGELEETRKNIRDWAGDPYAKIIEE